MTKTDGFDAFLRNLFKTLLKEGKVADDGITAGICKAPEAEAKNSDSDLSEPKNE